MRVTHIMLGLDAGGAEQLVIQTVMAHSTAGVLAELVVLDSRRLALASRIGGAGGAVRVAPSNPLRAVAWLRTVLRSSDVVHTHAPSVGAAVRLLNKSISHRTRPALVHTEHNLWSSHRRFTRLANRHTLGFVDRIVAVSKPVGDSIEDPRGRRPLVHHHGIDGSGLRGQAATVDTDGFRASLGIELGRPIVLTVANPRPQKAYDVLLEAFRRHEVARHGPVLLAAGEGPDLDRLRAQVKRDHLDDRIKFLGARDDVPRLMALADVFVLASHSEGLPVALMEAATLGLPTIATAVGGVPEIIDDGQTGLLVQRGDVAGLATALDEVLDNPDLRARLGDEARHRSHRFDVRATANWYADLYGRLVADAAER